MRPLRRTSVVTAVLCLLTLHARGQGDGFHFWHLTPREGLFSETNLTIGQGPDGYIWLTSGHLLQRYDGLEFHTYHFRPDSIFDSAVKPFYIQLVDRGNHVWCTTDSAVYRFTPATQVWQKIEICAPARGRLLLSGIFYSTKMLQDRAGNIWMNNAIEGLVRFNEKKGCFELPLLPGAQAPSDSQGIAEDRGGAIWFMRGGRLCRYDPVSGAFWQESHNPENHPAIGLKGQIVFIDSKDRIWISGWGDTNFDLICVDLTTGENRWFPGFYAISTFAEDRYGRIWMGRYYNKSLYYYDPRTGEIASIPSQWWKQNGLHADEHIAYLLMDNQRNLWALDWYNVNIFRPDRQQIFTFNHDPAEEGLRLPYHEVNDHFQASDGTVFVSYWHEKGGVAVLDSNLQLSEVWGWSDTSVIFPRYCWTILDDRQGRIWINQQNNYLAIYDTKAGKSRKLNPPEFQGSSPGSAIRDRDGDLWFGLWRQNGLVRWSNRGQKFFHYPIESEKEWGLVKSMQEDHSGHYLWLGTEWGLFLFDKDKGALSAAYPVLDNIPWVSITGIRYLNDSTLALGSTEGLLSFDIASGKGKPLLTASGKRTPGNKGEIHFDSRGNIWFDYQNGVGKYNLRSRQISLYGSEEWVDDITYQGLSRNRLLDGRLFVAVKNHFAIFHPDSMPDAQPPPPPRISRVLLHNRDLPEVRWSSGMELAHDSNFVAFHFSCLRFFEPALKFRRRLLGLEKEWSAPSRENFAVYTSLPPGRYTFQVQAINREGMEGLVTGLSFRIFPPWYATWQFRTLLLMAFTTLLYAIFRYRELQRLQQEKLRLRIARDLHDEMGSTLSSISILSEAALRHLQADIDRARFGIIGERARQVMEAMSDIVWSVNPRNDTMANVVQRMKEFAVEILESQGIALHFETDEAVQTLNLPMEKRKDFYLLFKEAVNNAAKYSRASEVRVQVSAGNGALSLEVRDNGRGFDLALVKPGNGLWNMQRRAERMGGRFTLHSLPGQGTNISLTFGKYQSPL